MRPFAETGIARRSACPPFPFLFQIRIAAHGEHTRDLRSRKLLRGFIHVSDDQIDESIRVRQSTRVAQHLYHHSAAKTAGLDPLAQRVDRVYLACQQMHEPRTALRQVARKLEIVADNDGQACVEVRVPHDFAGWRYGGRCRTDVRNKQRESRKQCRRPN